MQWRPESGHKFDIGQMGANTMKMCGHGILTSHSQGVDAQGAWRASHHQNRESLVAFGFAHPPGKSGLQRGGVIFCGQPEIFVKRRRRDAQVPIRGTGFISVHQFPDESHFAFALSLRD